LATGFSVYLRFIKIPPRLNLYIDFKSARVEPVGALPLRISFIRFLKLVELVIFIPSPLNLSVNHLLSPLLLILGTVPSRDELDGDTVIVLPVLGVAVALEVGVTGD
jgi:hypothetical protein